jgi:hypothetical protein
MHGTFLGPKVLTVDFYPLKGTVIVTGSGHGFEEISAGNWCPVIQVT